MQLIQMVIMEITIKLQIVYKFHNLRLYLRSIQDLAKSRQKKTPIKGKKSGSETPHRLRLPLREERSGKITCVI